MSNKNRASLIKNTALLYVRMIVIMSVTFYTSRIVLDVLGVEDFGIYNVIGGFVVMLGFLNGSMISATQRYLSIEIGRKNSIQLKKVFGASLLIHFFISIIVLIVLETVGLWFISTQLNIPNERFKITQYVYQFSVMTFVITILGVPYNALIIAFERMSIFAWISIIEVCLNLCMVFFLYWIQFDKLFLYSLFVLIVAIIIRILYIVYCSINFAEAKFNISQSKNLVVELINYASWNLWGDIAAVLLGQGVNIILNIFFGPSINAARGIAYQIKGTVNRFVKNYQLAMNPQIIKLYASGSIAIMHELIYQGSKFSFFLLYILSLPILLETEFFLKIWLNKLPSYTIIFTQLILLNILIDSVSGTLMTAAQASGKIKAYQGIVGGLLLGVLPVTYIFFSLGYPPETSFYVSLVFSLIAMLLRLKIVSSLINLSISGFVKNVIFRILVVIMFSLLIIQIFDVLFNAVISQTLIKILFYLFVSVISIYFIGFTKDEKQFVSKKLKSFRYIYICK